MLSTVPAAGRGELASTGPRPAPALFTRMSRAPSASTTVRTAAATSASIATSQASASPGVARPAAVFSASTRSRSSSATRAPCAAITRAIPAPMPRAPPVMSATLPISMCRPPGLGSRSSRRRTRPLVPGVLAELDLLDLARAGHREPVDESDATRDLEARQVAATVLDHLALGQPAARLELHEGHRHFREPG